MISFEQKKKKVSKKNLPDIVKKLLSQFAEGSIGATDLQYRDEIVERIINICSQNGYQFISDFEWYISTLIVSFLFLFLFFFFLFFFFS